MFLQWPLVLFCHRCHLTHGPTLLDLLTYSPLLHLCCVVPYTPISFLKNEIFYPVWKFKCIPSLFHLSLFDHYPILSLFIVSSFQNFPFLFSGSRLCLCTRIQHVLSRYFYRFCLFYLRRHSTSTLSSKPPLKKERNPFLFYGIFQII